MAWGAPKIGADGTSTAGNLALVEPAGIAQGDLMIACIGYRGNVAFTPPANWNLVATAQNSGDTDNTNGIASGVMYWIIRGASAPGLTWTRTGGDISQGNIIAYSGAASSPYDTGSANTLGAASATVTTGTITTAEAGELIVAMTSAGDSLTASAFDAATDPTTASGATDTATVPTAGTWIERVDRTTTLGADHGLAIADAIRATAGATGTIQATISASARHVMIAAAFKKGAEFAGTQAATRFYGDGTESGSTALAAQDANHTLSVSADTPFQVRARIQETGAGVGGVSTDDYQLYYSKNSGSYFPVGDASGQIIDRYDFFNYDDTVRQLTTVSTTLRHGQSITGTGVAIGSVKFLLSKSNTPTGNAVATIYAHSGTFGTSSVGTGSALATSDTFDVSTLTTTLEPITFTFSGGNQITLTNGTKYVVAVEYTASNSVNVVNVGVDGSSPSHGGNMTTFSGGVWSADANADVCFQLFPVSPAIPIVGFNSTNLTANEATTNRLTGGTGSFVAGKVSEDGEVNAIQLTASNFTELLFSVQAVQAQVADADTYDFRVYRNGVALDAYTVTPRITISSSAVVTLSGSATGAGTASGGLTVIKKLSGAASGAGVMSGDLISSDKLSGTITGAGVASGSLTVARKLSGTITGAGVASGSVSQIVKLSGAADGAGVASGVLTTPKILSGSASGEGVASGSLVIARTLSGSITGASNVTGDLISSDKLSGSITGASNVAGSLVVARILSGSITGTSVASGGITLVKKLSGVTTGASNVTGSLASAQLLSGTVSGTSNVSGSLTVARKLSGTITGDSVSSGSLAVARLLSGSTLGEATASGGLSVAKALSGTTSGAGTLSGSLTVQTDNQKLLAGTATGAGVASGSLSVTKKLSGVSTGNGVASGGLTVVKQFAGSASGTSVASGGLKVIKPLSGAPDGSSNVTGAVSLIKRLQGSVTGDSNASGGLAANVVLLSGTASGASNVSGTLIRAHSLSGIITGNGVMSGSILRVAKLSGTITGGSSATGGLENREILLIETDDDGSAWIEQW